MNLLKRTFCSSFVVACVVTRRSGGRTITDFIDAPEEPHNDRVLRKRGPLEMAVREGGNNVTTCLVPVTEDLLLKSHFTPCVDLFALLDDNNKSSQFKFDFIHLIRADFDQVSTDSLSEFSSCFIPG